MSDQIEDKKVTPRRRMVGVVCAVIAVGIAIFCIVGILQPPSKHQEVAVETAATSQPANDTKRMQQPTDLGSGEDHAGGSANTSSDAKEAEESRAMELHAAHTASFCPSSNSSYLLSARLNGDQLLTVMAPIIDASQGIDTTRMSRGVFRQEDGDGFWVETGKNGNKVTLWFIESKSSKTQWFLSIKDSEGNLKLGYNGECMR